MLSLATLQSDLDHDLGCNSTLVPVVNVVPSQPHHASDSERVALKHQLASVQLAALDPTLLTVITSSRTILSEVDVRKLGL